MLLEYFLSVLLLVRYDLVQVDCSALQKALVSNLKLLLIGSGVCIFKKNSLVLQKFTVLGQVVSCNRVLLLKAYLGLFVFFKNPLVNFCSSNQ